jgi:hypothetical protein
MTDTCATCRFGHTVEETRFCRFDPPEFVPPSGSQIKPVRADGWCGKYEKEQKRRTTTKAPSSAS